MLKMLEKLVGIPSPYLEERALADYLAGYLEELGCNVVRVASGERDNLVVTTSEAQRYLGFYSHLDTVHPAEDYSVDPYQLYIAGDTASGLGVCDSKGGMVAIIEALEFALKNNYPVKALFCVDQENFSQGAYDVIDAGAADDIDFLVFSEIGHAIDFSSKFSVVSGRNGRLVFDIHVESERDWSHPSNAAFQAARLVTELKRLEESLKDNAGAPILIPDAIKADRNSGKGRGSRCHLRCTIATTPLFGDEQFRSWLTDYSDSIEGQIDLSLMARPTPYLKAYEIDREHEFVKTLHTHIVEPHGVVPRITPSVADENVFAAHGVQVFTLGAIGGGGHSSNEWVNIESLQTVRDLYREIIKLYYGDVNF